jgi:hypothetical protein
MKLLFDMDAASKVRRGGARHDLVFLVINRWGRLGYLCELLLVAPYRF